MESATIDTSKNKEKLKSDEQYSSYPFYTIEELRFRTKQVADRFGVGTLVSRKDICTLLGKAEPTLMNYFSSNIQYKFFENVPSKGVITTELFQNTETSNSEDERKAALIVAFGNPPLYKKLIENFNNKVLPNEIGLAELLRSKDYGIHTNTSSRAARVFFENGKALDLIDSNNRLRYLQMKTQQSATSFQPDSTQKSSSVITTFELPIDLTGEKVAYLKYPKNEMTIEDINMLEIMVGAYILSMKARLKLTINNSNTFNDKTNGAQ
jgi:hypothetical protein